MININLAAYDQANLAEASSSDKIASQFVANNEAGFGGQDTTQGGQSSTNQVKRSVQRHF